jgi:hypothetical protein
VSGTAKALAASIRGETGKILFPVVVKNLLSTPAFD